MASLGDFATVATVIVSVLGWKVINDQNIRTQERKEDRALIDNIKERSKIIYDTALIYFLKDKSNDCAKK